MKKVLSTIEHRKHLSIIVNDFDTFFANNYDFNKIVYTDWSAKDVLAHVVMWHESFARNVEDIVNNRKPNPLKGSLTDLNEKGVLENKHISVNELREKLRRAQLTIDNHIMDKRIVLIPYKKGSRDYSKEEHLEVVARHISKHLKDIEKIYS